MFEYFADDSYRMLVTIPEVCVYKSKQNIWLVEIWIAEDLFEYLHPFLFPDFFKKKLTSDEFEVIVEIIKIFSSNSVRKEFHIPRFLNSKNKNLNGSRQKKIKEFFIKYLMIFQKEYKLRNEILFSSSPIEYKKIDELTSEDFSFSKSFSVFEIIDLTFK